MRTTAPTITLTLLTAALLSLAPACAQKGRVRTLSEEGLTFTLPEGWEWKNARANNVSIKAVIVRQDVKYEIKAELLFFAGQFINDKLGFLESAELDDKDDRSRWKFKYKSKFQGNRDCVEITWDKQRGRGKNERHFRIRQFLFRRYGHLYQWTEEAPRKVSSQAGSLFLKARKAFRFGKPANPVISEPKRDYLQQRVSYKLPREWSWEKGPKGKKITVHSGGNKAALLFVARSSVMAKEQRTPVFITLQAGKTPTTAKFQLDSIQAKLGDNWKDVENIQTGKNVLVGGEKARMLSFTARPKKGSSRRPPFFMRYLVFKHKGQLILWREEALTAGIPTVEKAFKAARKGLRCY